MKKALPKQTTLLHSYFKVGKWLHFALGLFLLESYIYGVQLQKAIELENNTKIFFWAYCFMFSFIHIFLVLMDSWSRFQNYKRIKDQLFAYGFQPKVANNYLVSKCQRQALKVASAELGMLKEYHRFLELRKVKWHHFVPYFMMKDPFFIFKKHFWNRTFLEKYYPPKFNYKNLHQEEFLLA